MGKRKSSRSSKKSPAKTKVKDEAEVIDVTPVGDLRTAPPVVRMRAFVTKMREDANKVFEKLTSWAAQNDTVGDAASLAASLLNDFPALEEALADLEKAGFSPPRTTFTASTEEGDRVSVLDKYREKYADIMAPILMVNLTVLKKHPGKGGGLIVESSEGSRMKVATSHVVRL